MRPIEPDRLVARALPPDSTAMIAVINAGATRLIDPCSSMMRAYRTRSALGGTVGMTSCRRPHAERQSSTVASRAIQRRCAGRSIVRFMRLRDERPRKAIAEPFGSQEPSLVALTHLVLRHNRQLARYSQEAAIRPVDDVLTF